MISHNLPYFIFWLSMATLGVGMWLVLVIGLYRIINILEKKNE